MKISPWRNVATTVKVGSSSSVRRAGGRRHDAHDHERRDQRDQEADPGVPRRPARRQRPRAAPAARAEAASDRLRLAPRPVRVGREAPEASGSASTPAGGSPSRCSSTPRTPAAAAPSMSLSTLSPTWSASAGSTPAIASARSNTRGLRLRRAHLGGGDHAVHQLHDARRAEPVRQRAVPVAGDHERHAALAQLAERRQRRPGRGGTRARRASPGARWRGRARAGRAPCRISSAQRSRSRSSRSGSDPSRWWSR